MCSPHADAIRVMGNLTCICLPESVTPWLCFADVSYQVNRLRSTECSSQGRSPATGCTPRPQTPCPGFPSCYTPDHRPWDANKPELVQPQPKKHQTEHHIISKHSNTVILQTHTAIDIQVAPGQRKSPGILSLNYCR